MNKKSAIKILDAQKQKFVDAEHKIYVANQTADFIEKFLGKESNHYNLIKSFGFETSHPDTSKEDYDLKIRNIDRGFIECVNDAIDTINKIGLKKEIKGNFLRNISEGWLIFWAGVLVFAVMAFVFFAGEQYGKTKLFPASHVVPLQNTKQNTENTFDTTSHK